MNWCFTSYEPICLDNFEQKMKYIVYQDEICPKTNRLHRQGYVQLKKDHTLTGVKKIFNSKEIHLEQQKGTNEQARDYCLKLETAIPNTITEKGDFTKGKGQRKDIKKITTALLNKEMTIPQLIREHPTMYLQYGRSFKNLLGDAIEEKKPNECTDIHIYWGRTRTGKSRKAKTENPDYYDKAPNTKWWDGYKGEPCVLIDEFNGQIPIETILKLCDYGKSSIETKGGVINFNSKKIIFTSNVNPNDWWTNADPHQMEAFKERIKELIHFT